MNEKITKKEIMIFSLCFCGVFFRYWAMSLGHNFDFDSYCIVGELASNFRNVYAETGRYNYAPIFFFIQGVCYKLAQCISSNQILTFRVLIVGVLTFADLGIACWVSSRHSWKMGMVFFLNPVSIIITGYHNQFDNLAVLFALIGAGFYNEDEKLGIKDFWFVFFLAASLITKHILFIMPFWLLMKKGLPVKKKLLYAMVPPALFLMSFVPFMINNPAAFHGILQNVFFYRSSNNSLLLRVFYDVANIPSQYWFLVFVAIMVLLAFVVRRQPYGYQVVFYLLALVTFSSAITNQYLAIPIVALCLLSNGICRYAYFIVIGIFLLLERNGLGVLPIMESGMRPGVILQAANLYVRGGDVVGIYILFALVVKEAANIPQSGACRLQE